MTESSSPDSRDQQTTVDTSLAHPARVYDYWLGGKDNFAADRTVGDIVGGVFPGLVRSARAERAFLGRAVRYLVNEAGVRQFLDVGTGLPTASSTHLVAQALAPESRVVYVDNDPLVLAHARALLDKFSERRHRLCGWRCSGHNRDPSSCGNDAGLRQARGDPPTQDPKLHRERRRGIRNRKRTGQGRTCRKLSRDRPLGERRLIARRSTKPFGCGPGQPPFL